MPGTDADQPANPTPHMPADRFRTLGKRMIDWVADYLQTVGSRDVRPPTKPGEVMAMLPDNAPEAPGGPDEWDDIFKDLDRLIVPNTTHWQHPNFFGYFPCNTTGPSILGELAASGLGVQGMLWQTAPAINELERRLLDQFGASIGLPGTFLSTSERGGGCIQPTASDATLTAIVTARHRALRANPDLSQDKLVIYASAEAHSSVVKAAMIAGLARDASDRSQIRLIEPGEPNSQSGSGGLRSATDTAKLRSQIEADRAEGLVPCCFIATLGTTATGLFDDLAAIGDVIGDAWLHVDAAWAGAALVCEEYRGVLTGIERVDSFCFNPHKWLLTNFDCSLFWTRDRRALTDSMSITPSYLRTDTEGDENVFDYRDWGVPLGRKARALKLWFVMRHYGLSGMRAHIRESVRLTQLLETWVNADPRFDLAFPRSLGLLCIESAKGPEMTRLITARVNESGRALITPATVSTPDGEKPVIRIAVGAVQTTEASIRELWGLLADAAAD